MKKIGIIVAMQKEYDALLMNGDYGFKTMKGTPLVVAISGIGKVNAAVAAYRLWQESWCTDILSFGCAGGTSLNVHVGDVIVGDEYMYHDVSCGKPNAFGQVQGLPETFSSNYENFGFLKEYRHGLIASGDVFVESPRMASLITQYLYPDHKPLVVDMESAAIAQVCHQYKVGFTSVRVVSDNPLTGERTYDEFWQRKDETLAALYKRLIETE